MQAIGASPRSSLTRREQEVLELVALGLRNTEIARQLCLSRRTVETHVERVIGKLGATTRTQAVVEAGRARLLRGPPDTTDRSYNLPVQVTSFIGRSGELFEVKALLANSRLVTIVGTAGVGKTRLAVQAAAELLDTYEDGVWFADLGKISAADSVVSEIAFALGVKPQGFSEVLDHVLAHLKRKHLLLIIDNCEHVCSQVSRLIEAIETTCPHVTVLATARENLRQAGEHVYRLRPLEVPDRYDLSAEDALQFAGVGLFVARARAADARFAFTDHDVGTVVEICRRLGGIPLALQLAASRVTTLNLHELLQRLHEQFRLLSSNDRTVSPRHRTMRATLDWSYDLLIEEERRLFCRFAIFQGGWTLQAASYVGDDSALDEFGQFDIISSLVDKSLVTVEFGAQSQRYRLLEPVRQYALNRLKLDAGFDATARRHTEYFVEFARRSTEQWLKVQEMPRLASIEEEMDNLRAALDWALSARNDPLLGAQLAANLWTFWFSRHHHEGKRWLEEAQAAVSYENNAALSIALALARARLALPTDVAEMILACEQALPWAHAFGDPPLLLRTVFYYGMALVIANRLDEAEPVLTEALELAARADDRYRKTFMLWVLCKLNRRRGKLDTANDLCTQMTEIYEQLQVPFDSNRWAILLERACMEQLAGRISRAIELSREAHRSATQMKDPTSEIYAEYALAAYVLMAGDVDEAMIHGRSILKLSREELFPHGIAPGFQILAGVAASGVKLELGARLVGYAEARFSEQRIPRDAYVDIDPEWFLGGLRVHFGDARLRELMAEGAAWSEDRALEEALLI